MIVVGGCVYPKNYRWISYPLSSSPHGGIWKTQPKYYQDYEEEINRQQKERERKHKEKSDKEKENFFRRFFGGFYGFDSEEEPEKVEPDYPYNVFGLKKSASNEDVKKAYRKSVLKEHPDKGGTAESFRKIQEAWEYFKRICRF
jgi:curved DNA-binding protein CbpA